MYFSITSITSRTFVFIYVSIKMIDILIIIIATVSGHVKLVIGLTHAGGGMFNLLMTDVLDLVEVTVVAPLGVSDHSLLSVATTMAQTVINL